MSESRIQHDILVAMNGRRDVRLFRNQVGKYRTDDGRFISSGLCVGSSDLIGWVRIDKVGVFLAIEVKAPGKRPTDDQVRFLQNVDHFGGIGIVADSVESAISQLETAIRVKTQAIHPEEF